MKFLEIAGFFERIEKVSSRLEMTGILAELFEKTKAKDIKKVVYLCQSELGPNYEGIDTGMGEKFIVEAIAKTTGYPKDDVNKAFKEKGDLGLVAEALSQKKKQRSLFKETLSLEKVFANFLKIASAEGSGSQEHKIKLLAELINSGEPVEAKYLCRIPLGNLRLGTGDPTLMDALAQLFVDEIKKDGKITQQIKESVKVKEGKEKFDAELKKKIRAYVRELIEEKYNIHSDLGEIAEVLKEKGLIGLKKIDIKPGIPIRPTLAERLPKSEDIIKKIGKCAVEAKYDGFRFQIHKDKEKVMLYSRQSENITDMFPEIIEGVKKQVKAEKAILEGEALAVNEETGNYYPFQVTITRKRKYGVKELSKELPLKLFLFDLMFLDGKNLMPLPFKERREKLEGLLKKGETVKLTQTIVTEDPEELEDFFEKSIEQGLEGIIAKDLKAKYIAGARKFAWIKLKRSYKGELQDTVDLTIIGYYKGKGKRTQFGLGALLTACYDKGSDSFKSVAKIGTGITEKQLQELEGLLSKIKKEKKPARVESDLEPDYWVQPKYVIEIRADEITKSPLHTCGRKGKDETGYALRFPRMISVRTKKPEESTTEKEILAMYKDQKHVSLEEN